MAHKNLCHLTEMVIKEQNWLSYLASIYYTNPLRHLWMSQKVRRCLPQALTRYAIEAALKLMLLSKSKAMKMGFNSLCAYASVNHLHWHLYYLQDGFEG